MKKLVTAACALVAGMAMAQVQSANIVGYQDFTGLGSFNLTVATFLPIGTDGSTMTLGNIVGNSAFVPGTDYLKGLIDEFHAHGIPVCSIPFAGGNRSHQNGRPADQHLCGFPTTEQSCRCWCPFGVYGTSASWF